MTAVDVVVGEVVDDSPFTVSIDGGTAAETMRLDTWTPTIGDRVLVVVNAETRARLYVLGKIA